LGIRAEQAAVSPEVRAVLRVYFDALILAEPAQLRLWQSAELTLTQFGALTKLRDGPLPAGRLAEQLGISPTSLTRVLDRLETRGLIERRHDDSDRRRISVRLRPDGLRLVSAISLLRGSPIQRSVEAMSKTERQQLMDSLQRLVEVARRYSREDAAARVGARSDD
jgi:DNA-binding MarR family transcriptional regulator